MIHYTVEPQFAKDDPLHSRTPVCRGWIHYTVEPQFPKDDSLHSRNRFSDLHMVEVVLIKGRNNNVLNMNLENLRKN